MYVCILQKLIEHCQNHIYDKFNEYICIKYIAGKKLHGRSSFTLHYYRLSLLYFLCGYKLWPILINPWRTCAARVTVVFLCVCVCVCLCVCVCVCVSVRLSGHAILAVRVIKSIIKDTIV